MKIQELDFENVENRVSSCGYVYRLMDGNEVVYVGQTIHINTRLRTHFDSEMIFDRAEYSKVDIENLDATEYFYIDKYKPKYNKRYSLPKGLADFRGLKKPNQLQGIYMKGFMIENDIKPIMISSGKPIYSESEVKDIFINVYGSYELYDKEEKKRLKEIAERSDFVE